MGRLDWHALQQATKLRKKITSSPDLSEYSGIAFWAKRGDVNDGQDVTFEVRLTDADTNTKYVKPLPMASSLIEGACTPKAFLTCLRPASQ